MPSLKASTLKKAVRPTGSTEQIIEQDWLNTSILKRACIRSLQMRNVPSRLVSGNITSPTIILVAKNKTSKQSKTLWQSSKECYVGMSGSMWTTPTAAMEGDSFYSFIRHIYRSDGHERTAYRLHCAKQWVHSSTRTHPDQESYATDATQMAPLLKTRLVLEFWPTLKMR